MTTNSGEGSVTLILRQQLIRTKTYPLGQAAALLGIPQDRAYQENVVAAVDEGVEQVLTGSALVTDLARQPPQVHARVTASTEHLIASFPHQEADVVVGVIEWSPHWDMGGPDVYTAVTEADALDQAVRRVESLIWDIAAGDDDEQSRSLGDWGTNHPVPSTRTNAELEAWLNAWHQRNHDAWVTVTTVPFR